MMALQRTLMAATRTAISLIGFGFTVAQFFERLRDTGPPGLRVMRPEGPRDFGLALIAAGILSLVVFTWEYRTAARQLRSGAYAAIATDQAMRTPTFIVAVVVILIGVAALVIVYARL
jgi:putative membrane protein